MLAFSCKKRSLGLAVKGGLLALGAPSTWSGSTFGEASASACLDGFLSSLIVEIKIMINVYVTTTGILRLIIGCRSQNSQNFAEKQDLIYFA
jgi:hypothetical protein